MRTVTLDQAAVDLKSIIQRAIRDQDETVIASSEGAVVVLDENEWSNIKDNVPQSFKVYGVCLNKVNK